MPTFQPPATPETTVPIALSGLHPRKVPTLKPEDPLFYISLGILAARLGKSWIVWVGLTIIAKPIGTIVAYFRMRLLVNEQIESKAAPA